MSTTSIIPQDDLLLSCVSDTGPSNPVNPDGSSGQVGPPTVQPNPTLLQPVAHGAGVSDILAHASQVRRPGRPRNQDPRQAAIQVDLAFAPVPKAMADYVAQQFGKRSPRFNYGFRFLSHLLAFAGRQSLSGHIVVTPDRVKLASCARSTVAPWTEDLVQLGVIERVQLGKKGGGAADTYRIPPALVSLAARSAEAQKYDTPAAYRKPRPSKPTPNRQLHESFKVIPGAYGHLGDLVLRLQAHPVRCDLQALGAHLNTLSAGQRVKWDPSVLGLFDGPNYASYTVAESGRLYTRTHNLQGVPKQLRQYFYPSSADYVFLDLDYKSQESWILARASEDSDLLAVLKGQGIYEWVMAQLGIDRSMAKAMVNPYHYGAYPKTIAQSAFDLGDGDPSDEELELATRFRQLMLANFQGVAAFVTKISRMVRVTHSITAPGGVTRSGIPMKDAGTVGPNHVIQGIGAVMLWKVLLTLNEQLGDLGRIVLPLHDGILLEVQRDRAAEAEQLAKGIMETISREILDEDFEIPVETQWGWRDKGQDPDTTNHQPARRSGR